MPLSYKEFEFCVRHFQKVSENINDSWTLSHVSNSDEIFLKKFSYSFLEVNNISRNVSWEYNIIYSHSYSAPVLYFNVCFENGKLLSLEDIETFLNPVFRAQFIQNKWKYLSQQEHPYQRRPFFALHPCNTEDFMEQIVVENPTVNPLVSWLSTVAPVIGLEIDLSYGRADFDSLALSTFK